MSYTIEIIRVPVDGGEVAVSDGYWHLLEVEDGVALIGIERGEMHNCEEFGGFA